jgi:hypothetical protein
VRERRVALSEHWEPAGEMFESDDDVFAVRLPTLLLDNKSDRLGDPEDDLEVFRELTGLHYPALAVSAAAGYGLGGARVFPVPQSAHRVRLHPRRPVILRSSAHAARRNWR